MCPPLGDTQSMFGKVRRVLDISTPSAALASAELSFCVGHAAGLLAVRRLMAASASHCSAANTALMSLEKLLSPSIYVCGGWNPQQGPLAVVERWDPLAQVWESVSPMMMARRGCAAAVLGGQLYVVGGEAGESLGMKAVDAVERYDPVVGSWTAVTPMPTRRARCAAAVVNDVLYVVGGQVSGQAAGTFESYSLLEDSWQKHLPMPTKRAGCGAAVAQGNLYVLGGHWGGQAMATAERFDPCGGGWEQLQRMCSRRSHCAAAHLGHSLWVAGGLDSACVFQASQAFRGDRELTHRSLERYDLCKGDWEVCQQPLPSPVWGCSAVACRGRLHVFGGCDGQQTKDEVSALDPRGLNTWASLPAMKLRRWGAGAAAL